MPAVIRDTDSHSPQPVAKKLATPNSHAEDRRTNGNGNARRESERGESNGDTVTEGGESEDGEEDAEAETSDVKMGHDHDGDGGKEEDEDEEEEEDNEEEDGEDNDGEEEEPSLKYERMGGAVNDLLKKDSASALAVSGKHLVRTLSNLGRCTRPLCRPRPLVPMAASFTCSIWLENASSPSNLTKLL